MIKPSQLVLDVSAIEINRLVGTIKKGIASPVLNLIGDDAKSDIKELTTPFKGVSSISISDDNAIKILNKENLTLQVVPSVVTQEAFLINKQGYDYEQFIYVDDKEGLFDWVLRKYKGKDRENILNGSQPLRIRPNTEASALGSPERDFFGLAFKKLIYKKAKYGLSDK